MKVVVGASSFASKSDKAINLLLEKGVEVVKNPYGRKMNEEEIIQHLEGAAGLLAGLEPLNKNVFSHSPQLKAIARIGIGMDNVDITAAEACGIKVSNTPDGPTAAVSEMVLGVLLSIGRQIIPANNDMHRKIWNKRIGFSISGLKVLVVGYGHIGQKVSELLKSLGANILIYDKYQPEINTVPTLEDGLRMADVVTLHASGKEEIITQAMFSIMKKGIVILNSARGGLINEDGLYHALKDGTVSNFWGDVFWEEPYTGKLSECENAILTPHISTYNKQCRESMETEAVLNLIKDLGI